MRKVILTVFISFILFILWYFHFRGLKFYDEGWILWATSRLTNDETPYKDFQFIYNPGVLYLNAVFFKLFGESIFSERLLALSNSLVSLFLLYKLSGKLKFSVLSTLFVLLIFLFWGPTHINFAWPVMFSISSGLAAVYLLYDGIKSKHKERNLFLAGGFSALCFIFKQNFGVAIFLTVAGAFLFTIAYQNKKSAIFYLLGILLIVSVSAFYMASNNSLDWYIKDMYYLTFQKIIGEGILNSGFPWEYPAPIYMKVLKILLYLFPAIISVWAIILSYKKKRELIPVFSFTLFFYLLSIRPTTDILHLSPLLAISAVPFAFVIRQTRQLRLKLFLLIAAFLILILGIYSSFFKGYYKWGNPIGYYNAFLNLPKGKIYIEDQQKDLVKLTDFVSKNYPDEKYMFVYGFSPIYYFLTGKQNPTRYDYVQGNLNNKTRNEIVNILEEKKVKLLMLDVNITYDNSIIGKYINKNFKLIKGFPNLGVVLWTPKNF